MNILSRLEKLEASNSNEVMFIWCWDDESEGEAKARWKAQHPGDDRLDRPGVSIMLFTWGRPQ